MSNFTGTAGTLVVTIDSAALWTDSRYFVQATKQLEGTGITLMKQKMKGTPTIHQWLKTNLASGSGVLLNSSLFTKSEYDSFEQELFPNVVVLANDFMSDVWNDRAELKFNDIESLPLSISGESIESKFNRIKECLNIPTEFVYPIIACDEVAWLCNIRGTDIDYNPLVQSYAAITNQGVKLFINKESLTDLANEDLANNKVEVIDYNEWDKYLNSIPNNYLRVYLPSKLSIKDYNLLNKDGAKFITDPISAGVVNYLKSIKNSTELEGFRKAFELDGVAWCKILKYIDDQLSQGNELNEYVIAQKLIDFRKESNLYRGESFAPIIAFGPNAALPHYSASKESFSVIGNNNFLLMDTGAQYLCGTTDTTRTFPIGNITDKMAKDYTLVLKGMVNLSQAKFPNGTRGSQLDILARGPLFNEGMMYFHGTCHGIGHYLCVHEGPQSVRMEENPITLAPGMVISNEPAIYFDGEYGIRTENVMSVEYWKSNQFNEFYKFNTLTLVPIKTDFIIKDLLSQDEIDWVNSFNKNVINKIGKHLSQDELTWLENYIR